MSTAAAAALPAGGDERDLPLSTWLRPLHCSPQSLSLSEAPEGGGLRRRGSPVGSLATSSLRGRRGLSARYSSQPSISAAAAAASAELKATKSGPARGS